MTAVDALGRACSLLDQALYELERHAGANDARLKDLKQQRAALAALAVKGECSTGTSG